MRANGLAWRLDPRILSRSQEVTDAFFFLRVNGVTLDLAIGPSHLNNNRRLRSLRTGKLQHPVAPGVLPSSDKKPCHDTGNAEEQATNIRRHTQALTSTL
jgi:hypothetical protein